MIAQLERWKVGRDGKSVMEVLLGCFVDTLGEIWLMVEEPGA